MGYLGQGYRERRTWVRVVGVPRGDEYPGEIGCLNTWKRWLESPGSVGFGVPKSGVGGVPRRGGWSTWVGSLCHSQIRYAYSSINFRPMIFASTTAHT